jgi:hypothetical protein
MAIIIVYLDSGITTMYSKGGQGLPLSHIRPVVRRPTICWLWCGLTSGWLMMLMRESANENGPATFYVLTRSKLSGAGCPRRVERSAGR